MTEIIPTRNDTLQLLHEYNQNDSLRKHAYAVEGVMRYFARKNCQLKSWELQLNQRYETTKRH